MKAGKETKIDMKVSKETDKQVGRQAKSDTKAGKETNRQTQTNR